MDALHDELDRSFGDGPPLASVESHLVAGRRALRRRRVASGVAGAAATAVLVTGWYAVSASSPTGSERLAVDSTLADTPSASQAAEGPTADASEAPWPKGVLIRYTEGELEVRPGVIVHEHIRNPYGYEPPGLSDALDVTWRGQRQWLMIERRPQSRATSESSSDPSNGWASFSDYVADQVSLDSGSDWPDTFFLDDRGQVVPTPGTRVLNRTDDPRLGSTFAPAGATTGAAVVSVSGHEGNYFVVWRVIDGTLDVITTPPSDVAGATFEELLSGARAQNVSGEGLR